MLWINKFQGDSGSTLNCLRDGVWLAVGTCSWVEQFCSADYPAGYARVSEFNDFINDNVP